MTSKGIWGNPLWTIFSIFILAYLLYAVLKESLALGWYFLVMFIITIAIYIWQGKFHRLIDNPLRIVVIWAVQVIIFSLGSILEVVRESVLSGSILTAIILFGTYLYIRFEVKKLQDM